MLNANKLKGKIAERGYTRNYIAETLGIQALSLRNKLNGRTQFTLRETSLLARNLQMSAQEIVEIFYGQEFAQAQNVDHE